MPQEGFESTAPVFERTKTVHALDRAATLIGEEEFIWGNFYVGYLRRWQRPDCIASNGRDTLGGAPSEWSFSAASPTSVLVRFWVNFVLPNCVVVTDALHTPRIIHYTFEDRTSSSHTLKDIQTRTWHKVVQQYMYTHTKYMRYYADFRRSSVTDTFGCRRNTHKDPCL
jgi:hypothetical protein